MGRGSGPLKACLCHEPSGWVSYYLHGSDDVPAVIELFRLNYERLAGASTPK